MTRPTEDPITPFLALHADVMYPRQGADLASPGDIVTLASVIQKQAEGYPMYLPTTPLPVRKQLISRLAFWLMAFPGCDNVVASVTILLFLMSCSPGGVEELACATMPPECYEDTASAAAAAEAARLGSGVGEGDLPRSRMLFPRLLYSVLRTNTGRVSPPNGVLAAARAASLMRIMSEVLSQGTRAWVTSPPPRSPTPPPLVLRLRTLLLHPTALGGLTRTCTLYAFHPPSIGEAGPPPQTHSVRAYSEASTALMAIANATAMSDGALVQHCTGPIAVSTAIASALQDEGLSERALFLLCETLRNALVPLTVAFDHLVSLLGGWGPQGDVSELGGPEAFFLVGGWGAGGGGGGGGATATPTPTPTSPPPSAAPAPSTAPLSLSAEVATLGDEAWRVNYNGIVTESSKSGGIGPVNRKTLALHARAVINGVGSLVRMLLNGPGRHLRQQHERLMKQCVGGPSSSPLPSLHGSFSVHFLSSFFNIYASGTLRSSIVCSFWGGGGGVGGGFGGGAGDHLLHHSIPFKELLTLAVEGIERALVHTPSPPTSTCFCALEEIEASVRIMECPLSNTAQVGSVLCALFFEGGGATALTSAIKFLGTKPLALRVKFSFVVKRAALLFTAHLGYPQCINGGPGTVGGFLGAMTQFIRSCYQIEGGDGEGEGGGSAATTTPPPPPPTPGSPGGKSYLSDEEYTVFSTLASRAANVPSDAFGTLPTNTPNMATLDLPATWGDSCGALMALLEDALEATHKRPPQVPPPASAAPAGGGGGIVMPLGMGAGGHGNQQLVYTFMNQGQPPGAAAAAPAAAAAAPPPAATGIPNNAHTAPSA